MRKENNEVRAFYDNVGWTKEEDGHFVDAGAEDLRPVSGEYVRRCHRRVAALFPKTGLLFLDCASGPVQYQEYREYSTGFRYRVCVDISMRGLVGAREALGEHGLYVLADITSLPFQDNVFDTSASLHTIYHVPYDAQLLAFQELYRVVQPGASVVVVYSLGPHSFLNKVLMIPVRVLGLAKNPQRLRLLIARMLAGGRKEDLWGEGHPPDGGHFYPHDYAWIDREVTQRFSGEILCWRSISVPAMRSLIHSALGGRYFLRILFFLESRFPSVFGRIGQYPLIVLHKPGMS